MKKFRAKIALILVLSLILAVGIPALAANTTKITGKYEATPIEVVIPTTATAVINPFGLPLTVYAEDGKTELGAIGAGDSVVTRPLVGYNASKFDLKISASVVGTEKGELKLGATGTPNTKKSKIEFEVMQNAYGSASDTWYYDATTAKTKKAEVIGQLDGAKVLAALNGDWSTAEKVTVGTTATETANSIDLKQGKEVTVGTRTEVQPQAGSIFFARLTGEVASKPFTMDNTGAATSTKTEWKTTDGVDVNIAWTIEAAPVSGS